MFDAPSVAKWFANKAFDDSPKSGEYFSPSKVQKLIFYAQGFSKILNNSVLFDEKIIASQFGPMIESVDREFKDFGSSGINKHFDIDVLFDEKTIAVLNLVYDNFAQFSALKLANMTLSDYSFRNTEMMGEIKLNLIEESFKEQYFFDE